MAKPRSEKEESRDQGERRQGQLSPYSPGGLMGRTRLSPLARLRSEFDRLFEDVFRDWGSLPAWASQPESRWGLDVEDQDDKIIVRAEAPGFEPRDFDIQVRDNQLVLSASASEETKEDGARHWRQEELYRSIPLPTGIDEEHVDAKYKNGILTITLPKVEETKRRKIEVKS
jgi:HSP20 family protein